MTFPDILLKPCIYCNSTPKFEPAWNWFDLEEVSVHIICPKCRTTTLWETWRTDTDQMENDKQKAIEAVTNEWNNMKIIIEDE